MKPLSRSRRVSPSGTLTPSSHKRRSPRRIMKENLNPNPIPPGSAFRPPSGLSKTRSPLPPRPPVNPLKRKLNLETLSDPAPDSGVQVIVRMRPSTGDGGDEQFVKKISANSVAVMDHTFTFDSVADTSSTQYDMYVLVGLPLVENCLAGFNSSIFAYGQTGSGKTYTMWGPPSALQEDDVMRNERGLTPRVFEQLFSRISEEQVKHSDKQLKFQCRCSFLEIYNEQITDLLDPTHRNLQIREDVRAGVYVDSLSEEYVCSMKDVAQLLIKGLANRRMGATNMNADSSRSHCVFTCIVESQLMNKSDGLSCIRTSRINLVDLAGSERQKLTGAAGVRLKEAGNINRSLSQLGNLINILAEVSQSGKQRHIPYRDSKLTFLLQESLGGNARLAVICAISPTQSCKNETFSTLRFAQCAKVIKNKAVVNEVARDDVNMLHEQIRQLKDELLNMKSNRTSTENRGSYSTLCKAKRSLNLLRTSLNRPTAFSGVEDESDVEMEIDEDDVERLHVHAAGRQSCCEDMPPLHSENIKEIITCFSDPKMVNGGMYQAHTPESESGSDQVFGMINVNVRGCEFKKTTMGEVCPASNTKDYGCMSESADETVNDSKSETNSLSNKKLSDGSKPLEEIGNALHNSVVANDSAYLDPFHNSSTSSRSIISSLPDPKSLNLRMSPTVRSYRRKSIRTSTSESASQKNTENLIADSTAMNLSFAINCEPLNDLVVQTNQSSLAPTEFLEDTIHNGFHVVESQRNSSSLRETSFRFSMGPSDWKPLVSASKVDVGIQTVLHESETVDDVSAFICSHCKRKTQHEHIDSGDNMDLHLVPIEGLQSSDKLKNRVPKAAQKVLAGSMRREMALEDQCVRQATEIAQLNRLVQQYKHERECNAIIEQAREYKIYRLERLMDSFLPTKEFMEEEFISLTNEHKLLKEKYEDHPEVLRVNIELNRVNAELDRYRNFVDMGERDALLGEIQDLRAQLQYYMDTCLSTRKLGTVLHPTHSGKPVSTHSGAVLYPTHSGKPVSTHSGEPTSTRRKISELSEDIVDPSSEPTLAPSSTIEESTERSAYATFEQVGSCGIETESKWIALSEELRVELEASRYFAEKLKMEIVSEKNSTKELKEALKTAMKGNARILEQYAELEEEHTVLLRTHRKLSDGIEDVKREAAKAGVKGAESRFINSLAAEISALRVDREKERQSWMDENRVLQAQLRDTAEAVQTAGELIVRLKEAEEAALFAQKRATTAEQDTERAYQEMENLKKSYDRHIATLNHRLAESRLPKETLHPTTNEADVAKYVRKGSPTDKSGREELEPFHRGDSEFSKGTDPYTWYSGYDRCNI